MLETGALRFQGGIYETYDIPRTALPPGTPGLCAPHHAGPQRPRRGTHPYDPAPGRDTGGALSAAAQRRAAGAAESQLGHPAGQPDGSAASLRGAGSGGGSVGGPADGGGGGDSPHLPPHQAADAGLRPAPDADQSGRHRSGTRAGGGGGASLAVGLRAGDDCAPPHGSDGQRHGEGWRVALQSEVPALLRGGTAYGRDTGAIHRAVENRTGASPQGKYPSSDLYRRRADAAERSGGTGAGGGVVRHPAEHQRPLADAGAVRGTVRGQP